MNEWINKWLFYPWLENSGLDHLINKEDLKNIKELGVVTCINIEHEYLVVIDKNQKVRVKAEGVKTILPTPAFIWDEEVREKMEPFRQGYIDDFLWDHIGQKYIFQVRFDGDVSSKRYSDGELELL